ncbi:CAND1/TIP120 protein [Schizosaccharomyces japonicus yFS275]|uniref:CAND1/TIP120 protein n=1 Tax=Schizosaccharomyces japonicus (strain yFS275 / FY16936) TaxID=402676 RepID=B6K3Z6_SCHJY|nr:CAND1/TIP120 protein [Schizosaccharomyces japonicus yFS275]EEB08203.1 CAND1/TIP120 protein [Schizosaccharomyces japonicus yFS275]
MRRNVQFSEDLLDKLVHNPDKDLRYMALNDLSVVLEQGLVNLHNEQLSEKIIRALLSGLHDHSPEVQHVTLKTIKAFTSHATNIALFQLLNSLLSKESEHDFDKKLTAARAILKEEHLDCKLTSNEVSVLLKKALTILHSTKNDFGTLPILLDLLSDILKNNGLIFQKSDYSNLQEECFQSLLPLSNQAKPSIAKKCNTAISYLCLLGDEKYTSAILTKIKEVLLSTDRSSIVNYLNLLITICHVENLVDERTKAAMLFNQRLYTIVPLILGNEKELGDDVDVLELRFEALSLLLLQKLNPDINDRLPAIIQFVKMGISYDPCFLGDEELDEEQEGTFSDDEFDDMFYDEDDTSWKVRNSAFHCTRSLLCTFPEHCFLCIELLAPTQSKLLDRVEKVRAEALQTLGTFIRVIDNRTKTTVKTNGKRPHSASELDLLNSCLNAFTELMPQLSHSLTKLISLFVSETKLLSVQISTELISCFPQTIQKFTDAFAESACKQLERKTSDVTLVSALLKMLTLLVPDLKVSNPRMFSELISLIQDKLSSQSQVILTDTLDLLNVYIQAMDNSETSANVLYPIFQQLNDLLNSKLSHTIKSEVLKLLTFSVIKYCNYLSDELFNQCFVTMCQALQFEPLQSCILLSFTKLFGDESYKQRISPAQISNLFSLTRPIFMKKDNALVLLSLQLLITMSPLCNVLQPEEEQVVASVVVDAVSRSNEVAAACFQFFRLASVTVFHACSAALTQQVEKLLTLNDMSLSDDCLSNLKQVLIEKSADSFRKNLLSLLLPMKKECLIENSIAALVAIIVNCDHLHEVVKSYIQQVQSPKTSEQDRISCIAVLGHISIADFDVSFNEVFHLILSQCNSPSAVVVENAATVVGLLASQNNSYVIQLCQMLGQQQYEDKCLIHSLREAVNQKTMSDECCRELWSQLFPKLDSLLKTVDKTVLSEFFSVFSAKYPMLAFQQVSPLLHENHTSSKIVAAFILRGTFSNLEAKFLPAWKGAFDQMLPLLKLNPPLDLHYEIVYLVQNILRVRPELLRPHLEVLMEQLIEDTQINSKLVRNVQMGPFQHKVDDGLPLRHLTFEILFAMLDFSETRCWSTKVFDAVIVGLKDEQYIKLLSISILKRLLTLYPAELDSQMEQLLEPMNTVLQTKLKDTAYKQEIERHEELIQSILRLACFLQTHTSNDKIQVFCQQLEQGQYKLQYQQVQQTSK